MGGILAFIGLALVMSVPILVAMARTRELQRRMESLERRLDVLRRESAGGATHSARASTASTAGGEQPSYPYAAPATAAAAPPAPWHPGQTHDTAELMPVPEAVQEQPTPRPWLHQMRSE